MTPERPIRSRIANRPPASSGPPVRGPRPAAGPRSAAARRRAARPSRRHVSRPAKRCRGRARRTTAPRRTWAAARRAHGQPRCAAGRGLPGAGTSRRRPPGAAAGRRATRPEGQLDGRRQRRDDVGDGDRWSSSVVSAPSPSSTSIASRCGPSATARVSTASRTIPPSGQRRPRSRGRTAPRRRCGRRAARAPRARPRHRREAWTASAIVPPAGSRTPDTVPVTAAVAGAAASRSSGRRHRQRRGSAQPPSAPRLRRHLLEREQEVAGRRARGHVEDEAAAGAVADVEPERPVEAVGAARALACLDRHRASPARSSAPVSCDSKIAMPSFASSSRTATRRAVGGSGPGSSTPSTLTRIRTPRLVPVSVMASPTAAWSGSGGWWNCSSVAPPNSSACGSYSARTVP